jgi:tetratricopeptide (TPR) repeat protein
MIPGLLVALALGGPRDHNPRVRPPGPADAHKDAVARFGTAVWNLRRDRLLTAARQLEQAARLDPDATGPLRELVRVYSQLGREPDAIRVARQVVRKDPSDADTAHALARLLFDAGELKEAVAAAKLASEANFPAGRADKAVAVYRDLATLCERAGDPEAAAAALQRAVELLTGKRKAVIAALAFTPREADAAAAECQERLGKVLTKLGKFDDAAAAFGAAAGLYADPDRAADPGAAARLGWNLSGVYQAKGEPQAALGHLEPFLRLRPVACEPYARLAALTREAGRDPVAVLRTHAAADPKNLPLHAVLAAELARDPAARHQADELFARVSAATNDPKVVELIVRSYLEHDRPAQVIADLDRAFTALKPEMGGAPDGPPADTPELAAGKKAFAAEKARVIGDVLKADSRAALAVLRAAGDDLRVGVKRAHQVHVFLGHLAARHRKLEFAAAVFREGIRNAPPATQADAYSGLIDVLWAARKPADVADACRDGLRAAAPVAPVYFNFHLAFALADLGDAAGALAAADRAIQQAGDPDRLTVRLGKLRVLRTLGRWDDAIALGRKLLDEFDTPADRTRIRYSLAGAYWEARKPAEAEAELRAILDAEPDHAGACNDLGYHLADRGRNLDEAEELVRRAIAADRLDRRKSGALEAENAAYIDSLGWVLFKQGRLPEARAELERAAGMPDGAADPVVWDHLGDVLFRLGEKEKAKAAWEKAADLYAAEPPGGRARHADRPEELNRKLKRVP